MEKYFENNFKAGDVTDFEKLKLKIPEGFRKKLNCMEINLLLVEQLSNEGLELRGISFGGQEEIMKKTSKNIIPLDKHYGVSKRLKEYLKMFREQEL